MLHPRSQSQIKDTFLSSLRLDVRKNWVNIFNNPGFLLYLLKQTNQDMEIKRFHDGNIDKVRRAFKKHMEAFYKETGIKVDLGNITYDSKQFSSKATFTIIADGEDPELAKQKHIFERDCWKFGLKKEDYGKQVRIEGTLYKIVGVNTRAKRMPIQLKAVGTGRNVKCSKSLIEGQL